MLQCDYFADCIVPGKLLNEGAYFVGVALTTYYDAGHFEVDYFDKNALTFNVIDPMDERSNRYGYVGAMPGVIRPDLSRSEEHTSELQSLMRISYAVFCLKKKRI